MKQWSKIFNIKEGSIRFKNTLIQLMLIGIMTLWSTSVFGGEDLTVIVTASSENPPSEGIENIHDGNLNNKWFGGGSSNWVQFAYSTAQIWNIYAMTSANDFPNRDAKDWTLSGSNDGSNWVTIDTRTDQPVWSGRNSTLKFPFSNSTAYLYYKLDIIDNHEEWGTQLAELAFSYIDSSDIESPSVPEGLSASDVTANSFTLSWNASSDNIGVTGYEVFRDGMTQGTLSDTSMDISGLFPAAIYSMTVRARDELGNWSAQSSELQVATNDDHDTITNRLITASNENAPLEGIDKLMDGNIYSKWLCSGNTAWAKVQYPAAKIINEYHIASANDSPERDPKDWTILGSNDGVNWDTLDTRTNETWTGRYSTNSYSFSNSLGYTYYKWNIILNNGGNLIQCAELSLRNSSDPDLQAPTVPTGLSINNVQKTLFTLRWNASTDNIVTTLYEVFKDGVSIGTTTITWIDVTGLDCSTSYDLTVRARDAAGNWSEQSNAITQETQICVDNIPPGVPQGLFATDVTTNSLHLNWVVSVDNVSTNLYEVFQNGKSVGTTAKNSKDFSGLAQNTFYSYTVRARDINNNWSEKSVPMSVVTLDGKQHKSNMQMASGFNGIGWYEGWSPYWPSGIDWTTVQNPWLPQFITDLQAYSSCIRPNGFTGGDAALLMENWDDRIQKTDDQYSSTLPMQISLTEFSARRSIAYEWQIDLCNRVGADYWVNIPFTATDECVRQIAEFIKTELDPGLKVYVEWSNETWNSGYYQYHYCLVKGIELGLDSPISYKGQDVYPSATRAYTVYRSIQVFDIFESVFGVNSPRIVKTICSQLGYSNWLEYINIWGDTHPIANMDLALINAPDINPKKIKVDAYGMGAYINGNSISEYYDDLNNNVIQRIIETKNSLEMEGSGTKLVLYEGGIDASTNAIALAHDPAIYQFMYDMYDAYGKYVEGPFCFSNHVGAFLNDAAWGLLETTGQSIDDAHKYRATVDWVYTNNNIVDTITAPDTITNILVKEITDNSGLMIYPNPARHNVNIVMTSAEHNNVFIKIMDLNGKEVINTTKPVCEGENKISMDVSILKNGIYFISVANGNSILSNKLIIIR